MKSHHTSAVLLLLATLAASGCDTAKPKPFSEVAKESVKYMDLRDAAMKSDRVIVVTIDPERAVFFRKEKVGTADDPGTLGDKVKQTIESNRRKDLDTSGGKPPDTDAAAHDNIVFLCAPASFKYGVVVKVLQAIQDAGGNPVGMTDCDPHPPK